MVYLVTTLLQKFQTNVLVEKIRKSVTIWRRHGQKFAAYFFGSPCIVRCSWLHLPNLAGTLCVYRRSHGWC